MDKINLFVIVFTLTTISGLFAQETRAEPSVATSCYPFKTNEDGYSRLCIDLNDASVLDTTALVTIYKGNETVAKVSAERKYTSDHVSCLGKEHDCREIPSSLEIHSANLMNGNGISLNIQLWQMSITKCYSGLVQFINRPVSFREYELVCPKNFWEG